MGGGFRDAVDAAQSSRELVAVIEKALEPTTDRKRATKIARLAFDECLEDFDPQDPDQLALFIHGPLAEAVQTFLGPEAIDGVCSFVERQTLRRPESDHERSGVMPIGDHVGHGSTLPTGPRPLVLLVSANEMLRDEIDPWLAEAGYALVWCPEADTVVAQCSTIHPCLTILDEDMPGLQRRQVVGLIHHALRDDAPPLVAVGRLAPQSTNGLEAFFRRPLTRAQLVADINQIARRPGPQMRDGGTTGASSPRRQDHGRFGSLLEEAMGQLVAPTIRDAVIADALARASLREVPAELERFAELVIGPLRRAITEALGEPMAEALLADLEPVVIQARQSSGMQRRPDPTPAAETAEPAASARRRRRVLLVTDETSARGRITAALEQAGWQVAQARDAHTALDACADHHPDAVVVDLRRAVVGGKQLCALVHLTLGAAAPSVVLVSETPARGTDGADLVVPPTIEPERLVDAIDRHLTARWTSGSDRA